MSLDSAVGVACRTLSHIMVDGSAGWLMRACFVCVRVQMSLVRKWKSALLASSQLR